ncbi:TIGR03915 family putative DNA repair protein [Endomicrobium proavitum]|uniref:DUF4130 domain-containing protein n=1 Tax=Endomicrobium proavitum TaxID=1408281 RepID=A0A0G3WL12_9BACT|nr:TIGR03915 family putative DNA repair protein [Endomicrobium proavitum]AKL98189.1 hypothetical protein Epro_0810 [Endomicrobium proavitum]
MAGFAKREIIYSYDGSFEGFLCCAYESFTRKEIPADIISQKTMQPSLFEQFQIETDLKKAARVKKSILEKIGKDALELLQDTMLTILENKELIMLDFLRLGYKNGYKTVKLLSNDTVDILTKAVQSLHRESAAFREFIRFSQHGDLLIAVIKPKNFVLPFIAQHFIARFPNEKFAIYDEKYNYVLAYANGKHAISEVSDITLPKPNAAETEYRKLWKMFYNNAAVEGRINHKLRMGHMPKRYWSNLTEFQTEPAKERDRKDDCVKLPFNIV